MIFMHSISNPIPECSQYQLEMILSWKCWFRKWRSVFSIYDVAPSCGKKNVCYIFTPMLWRVETNFQAEFSIQHVVRNYCIWILQGYIFKSFQALVKTDVCFTSAVERVVSQICLDHKYQFPVHMQCFQALSSQHQSVWALSQTYCYLIAPSVLLNSCFTDYRFDETFSQKNHMLLSSVCHLVYSC